MPRWRMSTEGTFVLRGIVRRRARFVVSMETWYGGDLGVVRINWRSSGNYCPRALLAEFTGIGQISKLVFLVMVLMSIWQMFMVSQVRISHHFWEERASVIALCKVNLEAGLLGS